MHSQSSVTLWIAQVREGDQAAAEKIWQRYVARLVVVCRERLRGNRRRVADEEDVVQEAFEAFFRAATAGQLTRLNDRQDLWRLLVTIVENRATNLKKHDLRAKRGGGKVRGDSALAPADAGQAGGFDGVAGPGVDPAFAAQTVEDLDRLLKMLTPEQRRIALGKMQGQSNAELARALDLAPDTIGRKLNLIRRTWSRSGSKSVE